MQPVGYSVESKSKWTVKKRCKVDGLEGHKDRLPHPQTVFIRLDRLLSFFGQSIFTLTGLVDKKILKNLKNSYPNKLFSLPKFLKNIRIQILVY